MADAARVCQDLGFDILDINFGCPVNKVVKCNGGSGLLRDLPLVERDPARGARGHLDPVHHEVPRRLERSGAGGRARWRSWPKIAACRPSRCIRARASRATAARPIGRRIAEVKAAVKIPVIGNGDIVTPEDAVRMVRETGCDAVMIGRAASSNPWIFRQIEQYLATGSYDQPTEQRPLRHDARLLRHADASAASGTRSGKMKQFATYFTHGVRNGVAAARRHLPCARGGRHPRSGGRVLRARAGRGVRLSRRCREKSPAHHRRGLPRQPRPGRLGGILRYGDHKKRNVGLASRTPPTIAWSCTAAIEGLRALKEACEVEIVTDSEYLKNGITTGFTAGRRNGWTHGRQEAGGESGPVAGAGRAGRAAQDHLDLDQRPRLARRQQPLRRTGDGGGARAVG